MLEAQQTVVDNLKELNGGKLTDEEKVQIKSSVLAAVKARLTEETINELRGITADVEGYLTSLIESHVHIHKEFRGVIGGK